MTRTQSVVAAVLSLIGPPAGHCYAGRFRRGLLVVAIFYGLAAAALLAIASLDLGLAGLAAAVVLLVASPFVPVVDAYRCARRADPAVRRWYQRWWAYAGVVLFMLFFNGFISEM
ncbi:MAG: hypothetical protein ACRDD1_03240, partial [Planctomycetia bacterium]